MKKLLHTDESLFSRIDLPSAHALTVDWPESNMSKVHCAQFQGLNW